MLNNLKVILGDIDIGYNPIQIEFDLKTSKTRMELMSIVTKI